MDQVRAATVVVILEGGPDRRQGSYCGRAALGTMEGSGTVRVSVPCVAAATARLRQRLDTGSHPMLAMSRHDDLTGAVVAHEIGHVLGLDHGPVGLMRAQLDRNDIISLRADRLTFSAPEATTMRRSAERVAGSITAGSGPPPLTTGRAAAGRFRAERALPVALQRTSPATLTHAGVESPVHVAVDLRRT